MLSGGSVQEAHDFALLSQVATLESRIPFINFFDGFRTSHEVNTLDLLDDAQIRAMIGDDLVARHRARALTPDAPFIRGTAHNPDTFFQARESVNPFYASVPGIVQATMDRFAALTGRHYHLFDYDGADDAERIIVLMGSGAETARDTAAALRARGEKVGVLTVRLYRPFDPTAFVAALPQSVRAIAVLEQTKEPGAAGEPLYQDAVTTLAQSGRAMPRIVGGRCGLSSKDSPHNSSKPSSTNSQNQPRRTRSPLASPTMSAAPASLPTRHSRSPPTASPKPSSTASAPTAPWVPTRTA
jgi:pyruvate-ferredoxin/flavodoxin oxidoreductase